MTEPPAKRSDREIRPDDVCARPERIPSAPIEPLAPPIYPATVWRCDDTEQADRLLGGDEPGYVYQRDGHPNADMFAGKLAELHAAPCAAITCSGMAAMSLAALSQLAPGDHVLVSRHLYGKCLQLLGDELSRFGIESTSVDTCDLDRTARAFRPTTRLMVVESIGNPRLRVADIASLSDLARGREALLLVDNTFASPAVCRPLDWGADLVLESVSKIVNGHSDAMLGFLGGPRRLWDRIPRTLSTWGLVASPFDCWLASRGLATMSLRVDRACENAMEVAAFLLDRPEVESVDYPGLPEHEDHAVATRQFLGRFGWMVTFHLKGDIDAANRFIRGASAIPFCPSLGEISTTLSHPRSTSHRGLNPREREELGISDGTIRLSVGIESVESILAALQNGLAYLA